MIGNEVEGRNGYSKQVWSQQAFNIWKRECVNHIYILLGEIICFYNNKKKNWKRGKESNLSFMKSTFNFSWRIKCILLLR